jgi:phosphoribosylcarboxyaminoimidazole (NCAIR) mutase
LPLPKTKQVEVSQHGTDATVTKDHSESGWTTISTFHHYLAWLAKQCETEIKSAHTLPLIVNLFAAHRAETIQKYIVSQASRNKDTVYSR